MDFPDVPYLDSDIRNTYQQRIKEISQGCSFEECNEDQLKQINEALDEAAWKFRYRYTNDMSLPLSSYFHPSWH